MTIALDTLPSKPRDAFTPGQPLHGFDSEAPTPATSQRFEALLRAWRDATGPEDHTMKLICGRLPDGRLAIIPHDIYPQAKYVTETHS